MIISSLKYGNVVKILLIFNNLILRVSDQIRLGKQVDLASTAGEGIERERIHSSDAGSWNEMFDHSRIGCRSIPGQLDQSFLAQPFVSLQTKDVNLRVIYSRPCEYLSAFFICERRHIILNQTE